MSKKNKDPFPITDVYHVTDTLVDAATVVVTDLCENLSNSINTYDDGIFDDLKKLKQKNLMQFQLAMVLTDVIQFGLELIDLTR